MGTITPGLFSFKNYQLMSVTICLYRRSGRAYAKPDRNETCRVSLRSTRPTDGHIEV